MAEGTCHARHQRGDGLPLFSCCKVTGFTGLSRGVIVAALGQGVVGTTSSLLPALWWATAQLCTFSHKDMREVLSPSHCISLSHG